MLSILLAVAPGTTWLSVHVHREHNTVADGLSTLRLGDVACFAHSKGLTPDERPVPSWVVRALLDHLEHTEAQPDTTPTTPLPASSRQPRTGATRVWGRGGGATVSGWAVILRTYNYE